MKKLLTAILLLVSVNAYSDKAGLYIGAGLTSTVFSSTDDDDFKDLFEDERATGWRAEIGYIWDLGKPGGFHLGVAGTYDNTGKAERKESIPGVSATASVEATAVAVQLVIEQEMASWADFIFKVGPTSINYKVKGSAECYLSSCYPYYGRYSDSVSETKPGATMSIGVAFFPADFLAIELARQGTAFVYDNDFGEDYTYTAGTWSLSLQYRF